MFNICLYVNDSVRNRHLLNQWHSLTILLIQYSILTVEKLGKINALKVLTSLK